jgi:hypothetical protein
VSTFLTPCFKGLEVFRDFITPRAGRPFRFCAGIPSKKISL